jgi:hypothetical protein
LSRSTAPASQSQLRGARGGAEGAMEASSSRPVAELQLRVRLAAARRTVIPDAAPSPPKPPPPLTAPLARALPAESVVREETRPRATRRGSDQICAFELTKGNTPWKSTWGAHAPVPRPPEEEAAPQPEAMPTSMNHIVAQKWQNRISEKCQKTIRFSTDRMGSRLRAKRICTTARAGHGTSH